MTTSHKVVLSLVATVCITLIVFYSVKGNQQSSPSLTITTPAKPAAPVPKSDVAAGDKSNSPLESPIIVGRAENPRPTGLDDLVAKVRSEVAANDVAQASDVSKPSSSIPSLAVITDNPAPNAAAAAPAPTDAPTLTGQTELSLTAPGIASTDPADSGDIADSIESPDSTDAAASNIPSFTLGEPLDIAPPAATTVTTDDITSPPLSITEDRNASSNKDEIRPEAGDTKIDDTADYADLAIIDDAQLPLVKVSGHGDESTVDDAAGSDGATVVRDATGLPLVIDPHKPAVSAKADDASAARATTDTDPDPVASTETSPAANTQAAVEQTNATTNTQATAPRSADTDRPLHSAPAPAARTYTIKAGDSFSSIARTVYGAERHWIDIADANPTIDPKRVRIGQSITLPDLAKDDAPVAKEETPVVASKPAPKSEATTDEKFHTVAAGENLSAISRKHYNTPDHWRHVYLTNRQLIGSDPGKLHVGMKLKITAPPKD